MRLDPIAECNPPLSLKMLWDRQTLICLFKVNMLQSILSKMVSQLGVILSSFCVYIKYQQNDSLKQTHTHTSHFHVAAIPWNGASVTLVLAISRWECLDRDTIWIVIYIFQRPVNKQCGSIWLLWLVDGFQQGKCCGQWQESGVWSEKVCRKKYCTCLYQWDVLS